MFKLVITMKKKPGMSRAAFIDYYKNTHLVISRGILKSKVRIHRRNFVVEDDPFLDLIGDNRLGNDRRDFDAMVEVMFDSREDAEWSMKAFFQPDIIRRMREDEQKFIDMPSMKFYLVDVEETNISEIIVG